MTPREITATLDLFYGPSMTVIADCMRSFIIPADGCDFVVADFSNIEGRGLAWLAGEEGKLDAFRKFDAGEGPDLYLVTAAAIFGVPVESLTKKSSERQPGKTCELAFGFQGAVGAYRKMETTAVGAAVFTDKQVDEFKKAWRAKYPKIVNYWWDMENAAVRAVKEPGETFLAGAAGRECKFKKSGSFLWMQLPSGRCLCYPYPSTRVQWFGRSPETDDKEAVPEIRNIRDFEVAEYREEGWDCWSKDQLVFMSVDPVTKIWGKTTTYGGSLVENATQGLCRDILVEAMKRLEKKGYAISFTVHDEIVTEVPEDFGSLEEMENTMCELPTWAVGFPITAEGYRAKRYRKG